MKIETKCLHEGYTPANGEPLTLPIYQSTTYKYESTAQVAKLFDLTDDGHMYSRISNPTVAAVEEKIAALEGGVGALCTTSGQAATLICILNILRAGDHILCASTIYGGTINLFAVTLKRFGIEVSFVDADADEQTLCSQIQPNTKAVFAETIANPAIAVLDIEKMARVAHSRGIPLIVDNTFATPFLCRPLSMERTSWSIPPPNIWTVTPPSWAVSLWTAAILTGPMETSPNLPSRTNLITVWCIPAILVGLPISPRRACS
jgi:OAH_OAS_sulfhy: O-acetylhomoserine aminocarboxypropyltransferase/cysteine synthase